MSTISAGQLMEYGEKQALAQVFLKTQGPAAATTYAHLTTDAGTGVMDNTWLLVSSATVYTATGYAPVASTGFGGWTAPTSASPSVINNTNAVTWGPTSSSPGTAINWVAIGDSATPGSANFIAVGKLATPRTPVSGDSLQAAAGTGLSFQV